MSDVIAWPEPLAGTPTIAVIEKALGRGRLGHSLLLHGEDLATLEAVAIGIADRLLNGAGVATDTGGLGLDLPPPTHIPPEHHPDFFTLRASGKARIIKADKTRELIGKIQVSASAGVHKVAIVYEADRMPTAAANIFLKTLEEPPRDTTLLLLTTRPHDLLPTIRSRCLHFRFSGNATRMDNPLLPAWFEDYHTLLANLSAGMPDKKAIADAIFTVYGLIVRFDGILAHSVSEILEAQKKKLSPELDEDELEAIETGIKNGVRQRLFGEIEHSTLAFARTRMKTPDGAIRRGLTAAIEELEHAVSLLRVNINESTALEHFLLASMRIWSRR